MSFLMFKTMAKNHDVHLAFVPEISQGALFHQPKQCTMFNGNPENPSKSLQICIALDIQSYLLRRCFGYVLGIQIPNLRRCDYMSRVV